MAERPAMRLKEVKRAGGSEGDMTGDANNRARQKGERSVKNGTESQGAEGKKKVEGESVG